MLKDADSASSFKYTTRTASDEGSYRSLVMDNVAGVLIVLDLLVWRTTTRPRMGQILGFTLLNVTGIIIILVAKEPVELWFAGLCGVYAILILVSELMRASACRSELPSCPS